MRAADCGTHFYTARGLLRPKWSDANSRTGCHHCSMDSPTG